MSIGANRGLSGRQGQKIVDITRVPSGGGYRADQRGYTLVLATTLSCAYAAASCPRLCLRARDKAWSSTRPTASEIDELGRPRPPPTFPATLLRTELT